MNEDQRVDESRAEIEAHFIEPMRAAIADSTKAYLGFVQLDVPKLRVLAREYAFWGPDQAPTMDSALDPLRFYANFVTAGELVFKQQIVALFYAPDFQQASRYMEVCLYGMLSNGFEPFLRSGYALSKTEWAEVPLPENYYHPKNSLRRKIKHWLSRSR